MNCFVTGCAGFIGSNLVDRLLAEGRRVIGLDNFSTGQPQFLTQALTNCRFSLITADLLDKDRLIDAVHGSDIIFHLAANADVRFGPENPRRDLEQNTIATHNVLEAMRINSISKIVFSSTGSVYGESPQIPTPEDGPFPIQTSLYGASKAACEGLISAYCESFGMQAWIFRFVSILGERYTHGHVYDFCLQLKENPRLLRVLGNGRQRKSYLYVHDCIDAIFTALKKADRHTNIFNLGCDSYCEVNESIGWILSRLGFAPKIVYSGGDRGWVGDNPFIYLETKKIKSLGWSAKFSIEDSIKLTVDYLRANEWVYHARRSS